MQKEVWRDIPNFQGAYQVSDLGNVKSLKFGKERILKPSVHKDGYLFVTLHGNNLRKVKLIHHLVAESFLNHVPNGFKMVIDHINDITNETRTRISCSSRHNDTDNHNSNNLSNQFNL